MARSVEDILKEQLGNLLLQLSITQSQVEGLREANLKLQDQLKEIKSEAEKAKE